ncbi:ArsA family ATPase [Pseudenhygromyxa sp. WMMC2535]|uniref:ArsA family ATPase n=1 Tax=Pseudenhygromyxa sp. WMMC2535 TaxID=2712867 RepID=UPI0015528C21|nr:ArsA-related P-loop ATPase [Pseudenhygromyxa sp. WMMC2535]NVB38836.1 ArsA family ATPase [Pseudenhygromyxa sp. WMMC2535]
MAASASTLFIDRRLVLCVGPGGVGKTTCSAALALQAATSGRKVVVVTIDPSRRLAQALGLDAGVSGELVPVLREPGMVLDALILDGAKVFDSIVRSCSSDAKTAQTILDSRIYQATAQRLSGALEFAAMARVQMLVDAGEHDLIILDTPPTANAVDFLEAPTRIRELIDNPGARLIAGGGRIGAKILGLGSSLLSKTLEAMGGGAFMGDLGAFLKEFSSVIEEFHSRGGDFERLLRSPATGVVMVTTASPFSAREAGAFLDQLGDYGLRVDAVVFNRTDTQLPPPPPRARFDAALAKLDARERERLWNAYAGARALGERTRRSIASIRDARPRLRIWTAPRHADPPDTLPELRALGRQIFEGAAS